MTAPITLHYRYDRDLPEFFTCLHGDTDGLHWGLLWDEPVHGFRGAASYYKKVGDAIQRPPRSLRTSRFAASRTASKRQSHTIPDHPGKQVATQTEAVGCRGRGEEAISRVRLVKRKMCRTTTERIAKPKGLDLVVGGKSLCRCLDEGILSAPSDWTSQIKSSTSLSAKINMSYPTMQAGRSTLAYKAAVEDGHTCECPPLPERFDRNQRLRFRTPHPPCRQLSGLVQANCDQCYGAGDSQQKAPGGQSLIAVSLLISWGEIASYA